jgi:hypothetical protein
MDDAVFLDFLDCIYTRVQEMFLYIYFLFTHMLHVCVCVRFCVCVCAQAHLKHSSDAFGKFRTQEGRQNIVSEHLHHVQHLCARLQAPMCLRRHINMACIVSTKRERERTKTKERARARERAREGEQKREKRKPVRSSYQAPPSSLSSAPN